MAPNWSREDVFGVPPRERSLSYVDRGGLDDRLRSAASTDRLIMIHGDSKQGKTWLTQTVLPPDDCIKVQCQPGTTPASVFRQALGELGVKVEVSQSATSDAEGGADLTTSGDLGFKFVARASVKGRITSKLRRSSRRELEPVGRGEGDLAWIIRVLRESKKRLVIEDFHYVDEENRRQFAFLFKALGDDGVHPVVIGVWPQEHLLTYYNGDLEHRIEDIHLLWTVGELEEVLKKGSRALNVSMSQSLRRELVADAYGNVGTLQALAGALCEEEGIRGRQDSLAYLTPGPALDRCRKRIATAMHPRFQGFADAYVLGLRELPEPARPVMQAAIEAVCDRPDDELLHGVHVDQLDMAAPPARAEMLQSLGRVEMFQAELKISPLVMTFDRHTQAVFLIDRRFLFYRKYASPRWPWSEPGFTTG